MQSAFLKGFTDKQQKPYSMPKGTKFEKGKFIMKKEYCYKAVLHDGYILYIGYVFGKYHVFVTDKKHSYNYSVYGGYDKLGTAENRLLQSANSYHSNPVKYYYQTKELLHKNGAFAEAAA